MKSNKNDFFSVFSPTLFLGCTLFACDTPFAESLNSGVSQDAKTVSVYLLIDTPAQLQQYVDDLAKIKKPNFNRVIFSFVRLTLIDYQSGSLADTGILGYYNDHDGKGSQAFNALKAAIDLSKEKKIQSFLSVGGWNYSCNYDVAKNECGPVSTVTNGIFYDSFPDPTSTDEASKAKTSYANLVKLANDLGVDGIDFDYEELWHADKYAMNWGPSSTGEWSTDIAQHILSAGGPSYTN